MGLSFAATTARTKNLYLRRHIWILQQCRFSERFGNNYNDTQKHKILQVINDADAEELSKYKIAKGKLRKFSEWKLSNGPVKTISDLEYVDGFTETIAKKLFDSILEGKVDAPKVAAKIKGQILNPHLPDDVRKKCKTVLSVYIAVNSVCWMLIDKTNYEVKEWNYHAIEYPEGKRFQINDVLDIAWDVTHKMPIADIYVMKAEATTLRAAGSDPNNPKVLSVNLQKSQMIAMIVALINARSYMDSIKEEESKKAFRHKVYFLRPNLPYRLYGTLVGNEQVSTDQTVTMIIDNVEDKSTGDKDLCISEKLKNMFKSQKDLQKDMLGHCLLLGLTFMDLCIYKNQESINKIAKRLK